MANDAYESAVRTALDDYERWGDSLMRALAQEDRFPLLRPMMAKGREMHCAWVERVFSPFLDRVGESESTRLFAHLVAVFDVYVWKLWRRDLGLSRSETEATLLQLVKRTLAVV